MSYLALIAIVAVVVIVFIVRSLVKKILAQEPTDWTKNTPYCADIGGLFGAPPNLQCSDKDCNAMTHELFYGHCRTCAEKKNIPINVAPPEAFHKAVKEGTAIVTGKC